MTATPSTLRLAGALALFGSLLIPAEAAADLPPPVGTKFVPYRLEVEDLEAHPDHVLLVYPWSTSDGAPDDGVGRIEPGGKLDFGRRIMGTPRVYAMARADYDAKKATLTTLPVEGAIDCGLEIQPTFVVPSDGPDEVLARYRIATLGDGRCALAPIDAEESEAASGTPDPTASATAAPATAAPTKTNPVRDDAAPAAPSGGCAACTLGRRAPESGDGGRATGWVLLGLSGWALRRSRRESR